MDIYSILDMIAGLALFLFGMKVMGDGLEKRAGKRLSNILERLTSNPLKGVLLGAIVTALVQSSSATTVMVVGFVNSGIMSLRQAVSVIMGANIGTTMTAWILSLSGLQGDNFLVTMFKPSTFMPILAAIGIIMLTASKDNGRKTTGTIFLGFSVLMFGMDAMSAALKPLAQVPEFASILTAFENPILGVAAGALVTAVIQSSSASVGILQALAATGSISYGAAIPILMGQNIGTCITALLSSIGANKNAKRAAMAHLYFNLIGTVVFLIAFYTVDYIVDFAFVDGNVNAFGIAVVHTTFNLLSTAVLLPFAKQLESLATKTIVGDKNAQSFSVLDERLLHTPAIAIEQARKVACEMAVISRDSILAAVSLIDKWDEKVALAVEQSENHVDMYEDMLGTYLVKLSSHDLSMENSREVSKLLHCIGDIERIGDHAVNISESAREIKDKRMSFSAEAKKELETIEAAVAEVLAITVDAFEQSDVHLAARVEPLEQVIDLMKTELRKGHITRLTKGECTIEQGFVFSDLLSNYERVSDHCSNIAVYVIETKEDNFDTHQYLRSVRSGENEFFDTEFAQNKEKYMGAKK